jgi:hypothetical protein
MLCAAATAEVFQPVARSEWVSSLGKRKDIQIDASRRGLTCFAASSDPTKWSARLPPFVGAPQCSLSSPHALVARASSCL